MNELKLVKGTGRGRTKISAFDKALRNCGLENYNLIGLSSIIPPETKLTDVSKFKEPKTMGNRLYCVYSINETSEKGTKCSSGIGWMNSKKGGILVEHKGKTRNEVEEKINKSLEDMKKYRDIDFDSKGKRIETAECNGKPTCVFTCAIFEGEEWSMTEEDKGFKKE